MEEYLDRIGPADEAAMRAATERQLALTKPAGSLGVLEELSVRVAGMTGSCPPAVPAPAVVTVFAADHGVHAQGVSPWPQEVTAAMLANFAAGGAAVNAFAANNRVDVRVVDVGVATPVDELDIVHAKVRPGTRDLSTETALTEDEARAAIAVGFDLADTLVRDGYRCLLTGDMGIANTTASRRADRHLHRLDRRRRHRPRDRYRRRHAGPQDRGRPVRSGAARRTGDRSAASALQAYGGLEHAALAGYILGGAANKVPVILDGVIAGAAALVAQALHPAVDRLLRRRAPVGRARARGRAEDARPAAAGRSRPAAGRGDRRGTRVPDPDLRGPRAGRDGDVRVRGDHLVTSQYLSGLVLDGRRVVVVGGGGVAQRRLPRLLESGAQIDLISPSITPTIEGLLGNPSLTWIERGYADGDLDGAWYVVVATDDAAVNDQVSAEAEERRIFCVRSDDRSRATAWTPASGQHDHVTIGVLGGGDHRRSAAVRDAILEGLRTGELGRARRWTSTPACTSSAGDRAIRI